MAFRRETVRKQFEGVLPPMLEPGERIVAESAVVSGPSPWLAQGLFGIIGILLFGVRWYFLAVTDRRVVFVKMSLWTGRPRGFAWADPRVSVGVSDVEVTATVWSHFLYRRPDVKDLRLNVHRFWREDGQAVVAALGSPVPAQVPPPPPPPQQAPPIPPPPPPPPPPPAPAP